MVETAAETSRTGLEVRGIIKRYSGVTVLGGVSVAVRPGEIVGLVGHNGAGKSTLLRTISGAIRADEGAIEIDGVEHSFATPADAHRAGIATVYQELSLLDNLTVAQNVFLGDERRRAGLLRGSEMRRETQALLDRFGLPLDPDRKVGSYPVALRQLLEIAIATRKQARYLLLDEPTTSLEGQQVTRFLETVRSLAADGLGIVLVDHKLDELYAVANRIVALVDGELRIDADVTEVSRDAVVQAIAGHSEHEGTGARGPRSPHSREEIPAVRVTGLRTSVLGGVDLEAHRGRVLGVYGLVGSGRTEFLRALVGLDVAYAGTIELSGVRYRPRGPAASRRAGIVYVTEERKLDGIVPLLDSAMNTMLPVLRRFRRLGLLDRGRLRQRAEELMTQLSVRGDRQGPIVRLSGGNQQKVLLARALAQDPRILLLDEPTKGVDLGVKAQIHRLVTRLAHDDGLTVVVVSSEEDEICEISDDVVIFSGGRTHSELLSADSLTPARLREVAWDAA